MKLKINDQIPDTEIFQLVDGEPQKSNLREIIGNGKIVLFGLPGAFTSTCSKLHLPGFVANADKIKAKGIEDIFCLSVNDPYVMNGWGEINNTGDKIKMLSDPYLSFTKSIGAEVDRNAKGMGIRSNRYLMVIKNFKVVNIYEEKETKECGLTSAENLLDNLL
ncbi:redoxin family protein [Candidatus Pelagibacter sp.]|uniref:redoxin family protein n=1 Tax=Candidatus Pelagibacter sp. TaxID=2024849 RepID=UPI003F8796E8